MRKIEATQVNVAQNILNCGKYPKTGDKSKYLLPISTITGVVGMKAGPVYYPTG